VRDLGKEIAAFASTNDGVILLGISDSGEVVGLAELRTSGGRAGLIQRIEGIVANSVKPTVTPHVSIADIGGEPIAALFVERGSAPLYYASGVPHIRQLTSSRAATPDEVIERILAWRSAKGTEPREDDYLSSVLEVVLEILTDCTDASDRDRLLGDYGELKRREWGHLCDQARILAAQEPKLHRGIAADLEMLAARLEVASSERPQRGGGFEALEARVEEVNAAAIHVKQRWLDGELTRGSKEGIEAQVVPIIRLVVGLAERANELAWRPGGLRELQGKAGGFGRALLKASCLGVGFGDEIQRSELRQSALTLRRAQAEDRVMGPECARGIVEMVIDARNGLVGLDFFRRSGGHHSDATPP